MLLCNMIDVDTGEHLGRFTFQHVGKLYRLLKVLPQLTCFRSVHVILLEWNGTDWLSLEDE